MKTCWRCSETSVLLLALVFLLIVTGFCQQQDGGVKNGGKGASQKPAIPKSNSNTKGQEPSDVKNVPTPPKSKPAEEPAAYFRIVPACLMVTIFVVGSIFIFIYERRKEIKQKKADIDAMEDEELSNEWMEHLRNRQRRKSVFQRVRTNMSFAARKEDEVSAADLEKARKYKIYDDMLAKYWQTLDVLRKGARTAPKEDAATRNARLRQLAEFHKTITTTETDKKDTEAPPVDQYSVMLQEAKKSIGEVEADSQESMVEDKPLIDPAQLHQRRRSSRFHKQSVVVIDDEVVANQEQPSPETTGLSQSYFAAEEPAPFPAEAPTHDIENNNEDELLPVLENITPREISAIQRLQMKMRPKSLIENLAAIHRESVALASSMTALPTSSTHDHPPPRRPRPRPKSALFEEIRRHGSSEKILEPEKENIEDVGVTIRGKQRSRRRPMSMYDTGATKKKISHKKSRARPSSWYIPQTIQEDKAPEPTVQVIDIDSLQNLEDYALSAADEDKMMANLEQQLIADVCEENDLSKDEIQALEILLEDVVSYSKEMEPKRKMTKQYSLLSVKSTSSAGSKNVRPDLSAQLSFTDSVSLFGDMEEIPEEDKNEETVLMSLINPGPSRAANRMSLSTYDNN